MWALHNDVSDVSFGTASNLESCTVGMEKKKNLLYNNNTEAHKKEARKNSDKIRKLII